jgi:hypothetical protein
MPTVSRQIQGTITKEVKRKGFLKKYFISSNTSVILLAA